MSKSQNALIAASDKGVKEVKPLSSQNMNDWNAFLDYVKTRGYEGSLELDKNEPLAKSLFTDYKKENPSTSIDYSIVPAVQMEMHKIKDNAQAFAARRNDPNASNIMSNVSKVDGFFGSRTSQFRFPRLIEQNYHNNALIATKDRGLVGGDMGAGQQQQARRLPPNVKLEKLQDGVYYEDPQTGDMVKWSN